MEVVKWREDGGGGSLESWVIYTHSEGKVNLQIYFPKLK